MKTLQLTNEELHILNCVTGNMVPSSLEVNSLLSKVNAANEEEMTLEDYQQISFKVDEDGYTSILFTKRELTPAPAVPTCEDEVAEKVSLLDVLSSKLAKAAIDGDIEAVNIYSQAIQRIKY